MAFACVFPGQGSQALLMGKDFYDNFAAAKEVYQEVDDALGMHISRVIFGDDEQALTRTDHAQPAIMATSLAILRVLEREAGFDITSAQYVAGHSLGEYSALCAAGSISLADTARLLHQRGTAMQEAAPLGSGMMAAILGLDASALDTVLASVTDGVCEIANDNAPGQIVISGETAAIEQAMILAKEAGAKRAIALQVSAPFHSSLIASAAAVMRDALHHVAIAEPDPVCVANVTADIVRDPDAIRVLLVEQVTGTVRWRESVTYMASHGVESMLEIGHGGVLSGLNRRINRSITSYNIAVPDDIDAWVKRAA